MRVMIILTAALLLLGCSSKVKYVSGQEKRIPLEDILENDDLSTEEKVAIINSRLGAMSEQQKSDIQKERDSRLSAIIHKPITPLKTPDKVLRVLILPYADDNKVLHTWKYAFVTVDEGKWIMGDYLNSAAKPNAKTLNPLK